MSTPTQIRDTSQGFKTASEELSDDEYKRYAALDRQFNLSINQSENIRKPLGTSIFGS